ncbi:septation protein SepH, partial [Nesterenkonia massiliensis]|uniref:septation protein SepH n=1 Tax=Nesterenkonia massiliensis TaxID=1232429 RepID=UPI0005CB7884
MQDLRIVGLDEENDPPRLMLSDEAGADYALPVDEALRAAVGRTPGASPSGTAASESATGAAAPKPTLSPREIQARLRAGATIEQVVEASGQSRDHVLRYAGPVADERAYIATRARQTVIAAASTTEHHRVAFGDSPATLEAMVRVRLRAMDVPLSSLSWDAWR